MPNTTEFKEYTLLVKTKVEKNFDFGKISLNLSTEDKAGTPEFDPQSSFAENPISLKVFIKPAKDDGDLGAMEEKILDETLYVHKFEYAKLVVNVDGNNIQSEIIPFELLIDHINLNKPFNLKINSKNINNSNADKYSKLKFEISDENNDSKLILSLGIEYSYQFNDNYIFEQKKYVITEKKPLIAELPPKSILGEEIKVRISDILDNEIPIISVNGKEISNSIIEKNILDYEFPNPNKIIISSPTLKDSEEPENVFPTRIRGKIIDVYGKKKISNCQIVLFYYRDGDEKTPAIPFLYTKTNLNGDFSEVYPNIEFNEKEKVFARLSVYPGESNDKVYFDLDNNNRLREYNLIVLDNLQKDEIDDCKCNEKEEVNHKCNCHREKNVDRLPEYEDLINDDQYTQDIGGSCVNFTKPNRTLSESTFYAVIRTTEPQIIGLDLMRVDEHIKNIEKSASLPLKKHNTSKDGLGEKIGFYPSLIFPWKRLTYRLKDRFELSGNTFVDWDETPTFYQAVTLAFGHLVQYRQRFYSNGYSLGNIITTEGLAPGQVKKIAILDWKRTQNSSRDEKMDYRDELEASTDHTQDFEELQSAMLTENSAGGSSSSVNSTTAAVGAAVGGAFPPVIFGVAGGVGTTNSSSGSGSWANSSRSTSASMNSQLADKTKQAAKNIRSQRATVITSDTQMETVGARTEVLANYNHCHSINNVFFEVLRHVAVRQDVTAVSECLFFPLLISEFTKEKIYRWKEHLKSVMLSNITLRKRIGSGFDALERQMSNDGYANFPNGSYADEIIEEIFGEFEMELHIVMPSDDFKPDSQGNKFTLNEKKWENLLRLVPSIGGFNSVMAKLMDTSIKDKITIFNREYAPKIAATLLNKLEIKANRNTRLSLDYTLSTSYSPDKKVKVFVRSKGKAFDISRKSIENLSIDIGDLTINVLGKQVKIKLNDIGTKAVMKSVKLHYRTKFGSGLLCNSETVENDLGYGDPVVIYTPCNTQELKNQRAEDKTVLHNLISICNENMERLHASIWMSMSEQKIFLLLDGIKIPAEINGIPVPSNIVGKSVASIVNPKPIGVVGNSLVLKITDGVNADPIYRILNINSKNYDVEKNKTINAGQIPVENLLDVYQPLTPVEPYQISFPTGGYFMETVSGACNSCEKIDDSRFWKWEEHPIPITPSEIQPVSLDSRYQQPLDTKPTEFPQSNISIQNIPQGPQPTGLDASLNLLGKSNLFKDPTGLEGTQNLVSKGMDISKGAMESAMSNAVNAMNSAAAYDLAKDEQKAANFDKLMKANLPPDIKEKIANDFANDTFNNDSLDDIKNKTDRIINQADTAIKRTGITPATSTEIIDIPERILIEGYQYALLCEHVYNTKADSPPPPPDNWFFQNENEEVLTKLGLENTPLEDEKSGFYCGIYSDEDKKEFVIVFRGSDEPADWINNALETFGLSEQHNMAKVIALKVGRKYDESDQSFKLRFAGHSLGGGLASLCAVATNVLTYTFNSAGVHRASTVGLRINNQLLTEEYMIEVGQNTVHAFFVDGEILSTLQDISGTVADISKFPFGIPNIATQLTSLLTPALGQRRKLRSKLWPIDVINKHLMKEVIITIETALNNLGIKNT